MPVKTANEDHPLADSPNQALVENERAGLILLAH
jgi:hypothetical protein